MLVSLMHMCTCTCVLFDIMTTRECVSDFKTIWQYISICSYCFVMISPVVAIFMISNVK